MEGWNSVAISALCGRHDRPHRLRRIQHPDTPFRHCSDGHGTCGANSYQLYDVCESLYDECGNDNPDSDLVVWENRQHWSSPEKLRPSACLHISCKWMISMILFITDIVYQVLAKIACFCSAMVYCSKISINSIYLFQTQLPTEIQPMVTQLLANDRITYPTNVREVS
jgi:hypothetical protein